MSGFQVIPQEVSLFYLNLILPPSVIDIFEKSAVLPQSVPHSPTHYAVPLQATCFQATHIKKEATRGIQRADN